MSWSDTFLDVFKKNDVRFISYVPDNVITPLIKGVTSDNYFISVNATRDTTSRRWRSVGRPPWVRDDKHFDELIARRFEDGGPVLLAVKIDDKPGAAQTPRDPALIRSRFMKGLGTGRGGLLDA